MTDTPTRRFPEPWSAARTTGGWRIEDASGQPLAYVYGDDRPQGAGSHVLTVDEARRMPGLAAAAHSRKAFPMPSRAPAQG